VIRSPPPNDGPAVTCAPSTGWPCRSTTVPEIVPVTSIVSTRLATSPRVASTAASCDEPDSWSAIADSALRGSPLISNAPSASL